MAQQLRFAPDAFGDNGNSLKLLFVVDPLDSLKAYKDSTIAMMRAAEKHGHEVYACEVASLCWRRPEPGQPGVFCLAYHLHTRPDDHDWYRETGFETLPLKAFDAVLMRKDPPFDTEYVTATWLLERAEAEGAPRHLEWFAALGLVRAALTHPSVNASLDEAGQNLLMHRSVHLGIAVDSPRGLIVPRIPDAQDLDLRGMGDALARLIETARAGRSRPEDLRGSTITITNVGVFGVDGGTPILNPGEVAILALGRVMPRPWVVDGRIEPRDVMTLALSFDHRVVDGATGSRVLREVADFLADPATALALG